MMCSYFLNNLSSPKSSLFAEKKLTIFDDVFPLFEQLEVSKVNLVCRENFLCMFYNVFLLFWTTRCLQNWVFSPKKKSYVRIFLWRLPTILNNYWSRKLSLLAEKKSNVYIFRWRLPTLLNILRSPKLSLFTKKIVRAYFLMTSSHFF